jgi:hypothetical protein
LELTAGELRAGFPLAESDLGAAQNSCRRRFALLCTARRPANNGNKHGERERAPLDFPLARQAILHFVADLLCVRVLRLQKDTREHNACKKWDTHGKYATFVKGYTLS